MTVRTIVSLPEDDKSWLDQQARLQHVPMTELIRRAVHDYRQQQEVEQQPSLQQVLQQTAAIWQEGDGLAHQARIRDEWSS